MICYSSVDFSIKLSCNEICILMCNFLILIILKVAFLGRFTFHIFSYFIFCYRYIVLKDKGRIISLLNDKIYTVSPGQFSKDLNVYNSISLMILKQ
jgi:hypothetical protein